jgi:hypothetical protein
MFAWWIALEKMIDYNRLLSLTKWDAMFYETIPEWEQVLVCWKEVSPTSATTREIAESQNFLDE